MSAPQQHANRPAHGVTHHHNVADAQLCQHQGRVIGAVFQCERGLRTQTAAVATMINSNKRILFCKLPIGREKVGVGAASPAVQ